MLTGFMHFINFVNWLKTIFHQTTATQICFDMTCKWWTEQTHVFYLWSLRWFHGKITREQAERLLYPPETGSFLVRESTNYPGDYTLCVSCDGKVEHYRIIYHNGKLSIDEEEFFENLMQLMEVRVTGLWPGLSLSCCFHG